MDKSINTKPPKSHFILPGLLILFCTSSFFCFQNIRLNSKIKMLTNELKSIETSTVEIQKELPVLRQVSEQVLVEIVPELVPMKNSVEWSTELIRFPLLHDHFKFTHKVISPGIPTQMKLPRELRDAGERILPGIIPFQVEVNVDGMLRQICYFLREIERQYPKMIVSKIDLKQAGETDMFKGRMTLSFPQIQYPEDIDEINRFVRKEPAELSKIADFQ